MDRVGEANRKQGIAAITDPTPLLEAAKGLLTSYLVMVLPGEYSPAYISHRAVERMLGELKVLEALQPEGSSSALPDDELAALVPSQDAQLNGAFAIAIDPAGSTLAYRAQPLLALFEDGLVPGRAEETGYQRVDVLGNARRVFSVKGGSVALAPEEAVRIGVWETYAERTPLWKPGTPSGAVEAVRQATAAGIPLRVLKPGDGSVLQTLGHSAATKASVQRDLDAGYAVVLPERAADQAAPAGWWRVNPSTGETLGISTGGYGSEMVEYIISGVVAYLWAAAGYAKCRFLGASVNCCIGESIAMAMIGLCISLTGIVVGLGGFDWFLIGDIGIGGGLTSLNLCPHGGSH
jgi:hypothetical protein